MHAVSPEASYETEADQTLCLALAEINPLFVVNPTLPVRHEGFPIGTAPWRGNGPTTTGTARSVTEVRTVPFVIDPTTATAETGAASRPAAGRLRTLLAGWVAPDGFDQ